MKAAALYCLTVFYFLISIGLTANIHFCGGKLKSLTFTGFQEQKDCCKGGTKKGCCENVPVALKKSSEDERITTATAVLFHPVDIPVTRLFSFEFHRLSYFVPEKIVLRTKAPPPQAFPSITVRDCVFRI